MPLAILLLICAAQTASALDCLKYKPAGARGEWHADVVAGKICWFGPNWRAFLPKPKARVEESKAVGDEQGSTARPERPAQPAPLPVATSDAPEELHTLRQATPAEAAALINAISLDFEPAPSDVPAAPEPKRGPTTGMTGMIVVACGLAIGGFALAMVIYIRRQRRATQPAAVGAGGRPSWIEQPRRPLAVIPKSAPPLQPFAIDSELENFVSQAVDAAAYDHK